MYLATFAGQNLRTVAEQSFDATRPLWLISNLHLDDVLLIINKLSPMFCGIVLQYVL